MKDLKFAIAVFFRLCVFEVILSPLPVLILWKVGSDEVIKLFIECLLLLNVVATALLTSIGDP